jgi:hypothetical protein
MENYFCGEYFCMEFVVWGREFGAREEPEDPRKKMEFNSFLFTLSLGCSAPSCSHQFLLEAQTSWPMAHGCQAQPGMGVTQRRQTRAMNHQQLNRFHKVHSKLYM